MQSSKQALCASSEGYRDVWCKQELPTWGRSTKLKERYHEVDIFTGFNIICYLLNYPSRNIEGNFFIYFLPFAPQKSKCFCHSYWLKCKYNCSLLCLFKNSMQLQNWNGSEKVNSGGQVRWKQYLFANGEDIGYLSLTKNPLCNTQDTHKHNPKANNRIFKNIIRELSYIPTGGEKPAAYF